MNTSVSPVHIRSFFFLASAGFASAVSLRACDPILPEIAASFATTPGDAAKAITYFGAAYAIAQFSYGFIGDWFGKLNTITFATILSAATAAFCALANSLEMLIIARLSAGITAAAIIPLSMAWLGDVVPYETRQPILARFVSGHISGIVLGQVFSGIIAEHIGWRYVFVMLAILFLVAGVAITYELKQLGKAERISAAARNTDKGRVRSMFRKPWVIVVLAAVFMEGMIFFGAFTFAGSYLWARFGLGFDLIGLIVAGFGIGGLIYAANAARLVRWLGEGGLAAGGGIVVAISFAAITLAPVPFAALPATVLSGLGYYMLHNTLQTHATQMAPETRGIAVGTFASCLFLGQSAGVAVAAPIFDYSSGTPIFITAGFLFLLLGLIFRSCLQSRGRIAALQ